MVISLLIIAACLYLPEHLITIANRMFYYFSGNEETIAQTAQKAGQQFMDSNPAFFAQNELRGGLADPGRGLMEP
jgi:hypothetical protein